MPLTRLARMSIQNRIASPLRSWVPIPQGCACLRQPSGRALFDSRQALHRWGLCSRLLSGSPLKEEPSPYHLLRRTSLQEPRRISKVCCSLQQRLPHPPATVACPSSKLCRSHLQQNLLHLSQCLPECYGSNLALAAAMPRGFRFCRGSLSATLNHFSSGRKRV